MKHAKALAEPYLDTSTIWTSSRHVDTFCAYARRQVELVNYNKAAMPKLNPFAPGLRTDIGLRPPTPVKPESRVYHVFGRELIPLHQCMLDLGLLRKSVIV